MRGNGCAREFWQQIATVQPSAHYIERNNCSCTDIHKPCLATPKGARIAGSHICTEVYLPLTSS